jgi:hypothetical protein
MWLDILVKKKGIEKDLWCCVGDFHLVRANEERKGKFEFFFFFLEKCGKGIY